MISIRRALLSVHDKTGIVELGRALAARQVELVSTGGTAGALREAGLAVTTVEDLTRHPEILDGRVKTLHPAIHAGLLARRDLPAHVQALADRDYRPIDLLAVNLYPFESVSARQGVALETAVEEIDIGGPALLRAAAKNSGGVVVLSSPQQYPEFLAACEAGGGAVSADLARRLARQAFARTAAYDAAIAAFLEGRESPSATPALPPVISRSLVKARDLRYGENPGQRAALYVEGPALGLGGATLRGDKEISYNNLLDADAAWALVSDLERPAAAIVKHTNPCGAGWAETAEEALARALRGDPLSAYGGILALNRPLTAELAARFADAEHFFEVIIAPSMDESAQARIRQGARWGPKARLLEIAREAPTRPHWRDISGGVLVQDAYARPLEAARARTVTQREVDPELLDDLDLAWRTSAHVKSNAIVLARGGEVVGVGSGQASRVDAVAAALRKAGERARGAALASDAFFPFADGLELAAQAGVAAAIQPGGSLRDGEVVAAADRLGLAMRFTGQRHFRH